ncbi:AN1-type zinc finger protein 2A-like isoform X1 [Choristoneura fumiferana]|uniref:AN1-type zinc finger protein 2A-like isoform X1 n=1 Tax=Choristoneura fumiferana TaxID=7141 RepID=UPI003D15CEB5
MEFPHIGKNCSYKSCNKLDFLPMKCGACRDVFCSDHFAYSHHECPAPNTRDVQVPVCPLCGAPVPGRRDEPPDVAVGAHIDNQCMSDPARERRKKVFTNRCSYKGCRTKEMVPLVCSECALNFCLKHRHMTDHACEGKLAAKRRQAACRTSWIWTGFGAISRWCAAILALVSDTANNVLSAFSDRWDDRWTKMRVLTHPNAAMARMKAAENRVKPNPPVVPVAPFSAVQGNMTEDEALAHALAASLQESASLHSRDTTFARALSGQRVGGEQNSRCSIS